MRIDRLLCELNIGTRSQVKDLLKKGLVTVNGIKITKPETKVDEKKDIVCYCGKEYRYRPFVYYMMNKPSGVISATVDDKEKTVLDLFAEQMKGQIEGIPIKDIFPVGRLDKDTVGLLLLTNDGEMAHRLLSPKKHVPKKYYVETDKSITREQVIQLKNGVDIGEKKTTKEAVVETLEDKNCYITITEGKFHQVKRMFQAVGLKVIYLKRISMGNLLLDESLKEGNIRELSQEEVDGLC